MHVCFYLRDVCIHVCVYIYIYMYACMHACMHLRMPVCMCVPMCVCGFVCVYAGRLDFFFARTESNAVGLRALFKLRSFAVAIVRACIAATMCPSI